MIEDYYYQPKVARRMAKPKSEKCLTLSMRGAAEHLGIGLNQAYEAARRGEIPTIKIGKRILVPLAALERMLQGAA